MNRRGFWKYLAAAPIAAVTPLVLSKEQTSGFQSQGRLVIESSHLTVPSGGLPIPRDGELIIRNCVIEGR